MLKRFSNILITLLASLIFFVGAGVTVIDLCCASCVDSLASLKDNNGMCDDMLMSTDSDSCCSEESHSSDKQAGCCTIERVSVDLDHSVFKPIINSPLVWCVELFNNVIFAVGHDVDYIGLRDYRYRPPIPIPPREYLSLIRILII